MKSFKLLFPATCLAGIFAITAFMNRKNNINNLQTAKDSSGIAVVELFTSEGCSSCPPADALIEGIEQQIHNKQIYILAYHVDYWDHQGWKDRFSDAAYTKRQSRYVEWLHLQTLYTPQIVVNGASEYVGSDESAVLNAISDGLSHPAKQLQFTGTVEGNKLKIDYTAFAEKRSALTFALVQKSARSEVKAGENEGKTLSHVQIVRALATAQTDEKTVLLNLPADFSQHQWEIIGLQQNNGNGHITAAGRSAVQSPGASAN
ncbi:DUF1223 domain-containing protein [Deminuibacter soli]|uniref:DUF1223 domain-containing protein n=1 Tax=Deminuibacter soli TaxID=2291815 RepID=A0A3E1NIP5_9BACT|nr:DUF1223 domain-containing protein [Deminuibacter soli]RFM27800.1 DUF1223 domain-containing protein [Deminuibacter soli]